MQRRAGGRRIVERTRNTRARHCRHCIGDDCPPHSNRSSRQCHARVPNASEIYEHMFAPNSQKRVHKCTLLNALNFTGANEKRIVRFITPYIVAPKISKKGNTIL
jgi:hypothetical protein